MKSVLNRMLIREIFKSKSQFLAAAAVVFAGITLFSATYMSYRNLKNSLDDYYKQYNFLDYYALAQNISDGAVKSVLNLKGVKTAIGRVCKDVTADMGENKRVTLRVISLPDNKRPEINNVFITSGEYLNSKQQNSCLINKKFADYYKLSKGERIKVVVNQKSYDFKISGIASSPEFIYALRSEATLSSTGEDFGIMYIKQSDALNLLDNGSSYNQLHVLFNSTADRKKLIAKIEDVLKPYGFIKGVERKDQLSNARLSNEIKMLQNMALAFPIIFLAVAALIIYIMLSRIVNNQRMSIAVMKAFGYSDKRIQMYYLCYSLLISIIGGIPAAFTGIYMGRAMTTMYTGIYNFPSMTIKIYWDILLIALFLCITFCIIAGYNSSKKVTAIDPAQAMRPEAPTIGRGVFIEKVGFLWRRLSFGWKVSIRNVFRNYKRSILTILGISFTLMFFMISLFFLDALDYFITQHFFKLQSYDYKVTFVKPVPLNDVSELKNTKGISQLEPIMEAPIEVRNGWIKHQTVLVGMIKSNNSYKLIDLDKRPEPLPQKGILIADFIADKLSIKVGDTVTIKSFMSNQKEREVRIEGIIKEYLGFNCYVDINSIGDIIDNSGSFANGMLIKTEKGSEKDVVKKLLEIPGVEKVEGRLDSYKAFQGMMQLMYSYVGFMIFFSVVMGFAIIFNTTVINITERRRELASLKVLGYTPREIEKTILRENYIVGALSLAPGIILGKILSNVFAGLISSEMFVLEAVIYPRTYVITFFSVFAFIVLAQWANKKNITGLDMVEVLKNREG